KTIPAGRTGRRVYAVSIGLLAALLLAPQTTEFGSKVAVLSARALAGAARPLLELLDVAVRRRAWFAGFRTRAVSRSAAAAAPAGAVGFVRLLVVAGTPARSNAEATVLPASASSELVAVTVQPAQGIAPIDDRTARQISRDLIADLENESAALRARDRRRATAGADGARLAALWRQIAASAGAADRPRYAGRSIPVTHPPAH